MYKSRLKILLGLIALMFVVLLLRLGYMQIVRGDYYRLQAERSLRSVKLLPGQRGRILDRRGVILAEDEACYDFCLDYRFLVSEPDLMATRVREIMAETGLSEPDARRRYEKQTGWDRWRRRKVRAIMAAQGAKEAWAEKVFRRQVEYTWQLAGQIAREFDCDLSRQVRRIVQGVERVRGRVGRPVREERMGHVVVAGLDESQANSLRVLLGKTVGASVAPSHRRRYPYGSTACHIIGVTGPIFRREMEKYNLRPDQADWLARMQSNYLFGDTIGKTGVEKMAEKLLRPRRGYRQFKRLDEVIANVPAEPGRDIHLTIDIELQEQLTKLMRSTGQTGSIVVLDVKDGDVLAMVSWPTYNLNTYRADYPQLVGDVINLPLHNRAVSSVYAPGSTVKPIVALAGLGAGRIEPQTTITCTGTNPFSRTGRPRCWIYQKYRTTHGPLDLVGALKNSCNNYFVTIAHWIGAAKLTEWMGYFGFGAKPGTGLPEERSGVIADQAWLRQHRNRSFVPSDAWNYSLGQGVFSASALQVAGAHAAIARGGVYLSPRLAAEGGPPRVHRILPLAESHIQAVRRGMYEVVNSRGGTAWKVWRRGEPLGVTVCGKTGTAQTPPMRIDSNNNGRIDSGDRIVRRGNHAWFAGFAPYQNPKIAFAVLLEYAGGGGANAGPIAKETVRICREFGYLD
jgi:penicillin-binding protein 2